MIPSEINLLAKPLFEFLNLRDPLEKADVILVLGSLDLRIPEWGSNLILNGWADFIVMSGGVGRLTPADWIDGEAPEFGEIAYKLGVPAKKVLIENHSTNTRENLINSFDLLKKNDIEPKKIIIINQPFMQKRTKAIVDKGKDLAIFPPIKFIFPQSPFIDINSYPNEVISESEMIAMLVGEITRLEKYPQKGFISDQHIPKDVSKSTQILASKGYTKYAV